MTIKSTDNICQNCETNFALPTDNICANCVEKYHELNTNPVSIFVDSVKRVTSQLAFVAAATVTAPLWIPAKIVANSITKRHRY